MDITSGFHEEVHSIPIDYKIRKEGKAPKRIDYIMMKQGKIPKTISFRIKELLHL